MASAENDSFIETVKELSMRVGSARREPRQFY